MTTPKLPTSKLPFEPPSAEPASPLETAGVIAAGAGFFAAAAIVGPVLDVLCLAGLFYPDAKPAFDASAALRACGASDTHRPTADDRGHVECTRCSAFVPYGSMSLNEDGYFCRICATKLTSLALDA